MERVDATKQRWLPATSGEATGARARWNVTTSRARRIFSPFCFARKRSSQLLLNVTTSRARRILSPFYFARKRSSQLLLCAKPATSLPRLASGLKPLFPRQRAPRQTKQCPDTLLLKPVMLPEVISESR